VPVTDRAEKPERRAREPAMLRGMVTVRATAACVAFLIAAACSAPDDGGAGGPYTSGGAAGSAAAAGTGGAGAAAGTAGAGAGAGTGGAGAEAGAAGSAAAGAEAGTGGIAGSAGAGGAAGTAGSAGSAGTAGGAGTGGAAGLPALGSLVILGDSIGDGGGVGPFYYDLLRTSLEARYGPLDYRNRAEGGSKTGALEGQVSGLPAALPGPVAVCITSGGNDMKDQVAAIVLGTDGPARAQMGQNISQALAALLAPARFGAGVDVHVYQGNIYDPSDGQGNYSQHNCNFGQGLPALPTDGYFASWNGEIATQVAAHGQVLADLHAHFAQHGFNHPPSWYHTDCTHPNATGHDQLRRLFYEKITGEAPP
jgi:lysophospholipase L1-like esterase